MAQCAIESTEAAGWLLVHSMAATGAVWTASSLCSMSRGLWNYLTTNLLEWREEIKQLITL